MAFSQGLVNGNFELPGKQGDPPAAWVTDSGTFICDEVKHYEGVFAGKLDGYTRQSAAHQDIQVIPGDSYEFTGYWRNGDKTAAFDLVSFDIHWLTDLNGNVISAADKRDSGYIVSNWEPFKAGPLTAPLNAKAARIILKSSYGVGAFDDLRWRNLNSQASTAAAAPAPPAAAATRPRATPPPAAPPTSANATVGQGALRWYTDPGSGMAEAGRARKAILLFFTSAQSETARYYETDVFADPSVEKVIAEKYIAIKADLSAYSTMAAKLGVFKAGTTLLFDENSKPLASVYGKLTPQEYLKKLR